MKMMKRLTAMMLVALMFFFSPLANAAPVSLAESADDKTQDESKGTSSEGEEYISEVRIGMGETEAEAKSELESEGFTILTDESGAPADLNLHVVGRMFCGADG